MVSVNNSVTSNRLLRMKDTMVSPFQGVRLNGAGKEDFIEAQALVLKSMPKPQRRPVWVLREKDLYLGWGTYRVVVWDEW